MDCLAGVAHAPATAILRRPVLYTTSRRRDRNGGLKLRAKIVEENDPLLQSAIDSASLRFRETHRPSVGAKIPRSCLSLHVPLESSDIQKSLCAKGFNGNQPSIWAMQGLPLMALASFEDILLTVSGSAMKGCFFLGELPAWLAETEIGTKTSATTWLEKLFMNNGFRVDMICYDEVARSLGKELAPGRYKNILFSAEQLRFSDDQVTCYFKTESVGHGLTTFSTLAVAW